jgi:hypothetical protein
MTSAWAEPILFYQASHDLTPNDDSFWVEVHADGTALVHYPDYMKKAGDYSVQLSPAEVQQIRLLLEHPLVQDFDHGLIERQKKNFDDQATELFAISDNTYAEFEINASGQAAAGQRIRWANLRQDAERYPQIGVLRKLAEIEAGLLRLDEHPSAQRVE